MSGNTRHHDLPGRVMVQFILALFLMGCHDNVKQTNTMGANSKSLYPQAIDSLGLQHLFDKTKWTIYCIYCDDTLTYRNKAGEKITFGMLNLKYRGYSLHHDSTVIYFVFDYDDPNVMRYGDTLPLLSKKYIVDGILFMGNSDSIVAYAGYNVNGYYWFRDSTKNSANRYINAQQPEVVAYISANRELINPWFKAEAIKRGVLKEN
ncbi:MAG: hypothetical protein JSS82_11510 [Bacteroidetes bacterium]|nr:hypothetical protein [Bacteroidota bacterium]